MTKQNSSPDAGGIEARKITTGIADLPTPSTNAGPTEFSILAAALNYAARGLPVFPCNPKNKAPLVSGGFHKATTDTDQIKTWWTEWPDAMIGMPTGKVSGIDVLDIDCKKDKDGFAAIPDWRDRSPIIIRTPSKGAHLWFKSDGSIRNTTSEIGLGIDTRGTGGYVIVPPSQNGVAAYRFEKGSEQELANLPPFPADLLVRLKIDDEPHAPGGEPEAAPALIAGALAVIPNVDLGWEEWNNIGMAVWRATDGNGFGAFDSWSKKSTKYDAQETLRRWNHYFKSPPGRIGAGSIFHMANEASPGWQHDYDAKLEAAMAEANRAAPSPKGEEPQASTKAETPKTGNLIQSSKEFVGGFVPPFYLIDGLLQQQFVYSVTGMTGHGKTTVMLLIAAHVACGLPIDKREVEKARVLFFAGENPDDIRMRWIKLCEEMKCDASTMDVFFLPGTPPISNAEIRKRIDAEAAKHGPFGLLIIDTSAAYFQGDDENSNAQLGAHARMMRTFVNLPGGPTVVVTAHPPKNPNMDNLLPRGGGAFLNEMDGNLVCINNNSVVTVHWHGKFRGPDFAPILFKLSYGTTEKLKDAKGRQIWTVTAAPISETEKTRLEDTGRRRQDELLILLSGNPHLSLAEMAEKLGWKTSKGEPNRTLVNRTLANLIKDKLVERKRDRIVLTKTGEGAVKDADVM